MNEFQHKTPKHCKHRWRVVTIISGNLYRKEKSCMSCPKVVPGHWVEMKPKTSTRQLTDRKSKLKQVSTKRLEWNKKYQASCEADADYQKCAVTGVFMHKQHMERHHPCGRLNERIMIYVYVTKIAHAIIHDNAKASRESGWLQDCFFGYPQRTDQPKPYIGREPIKKL